MLKRKLVQVLLYCGFLSPILYILTDIIAGNSYQNYDFNSMAISELFAIGAPTSLFVVILFSMSSVLLFAFAVGLWQLAANNRRLKFIAFMVMGNAINSLVLWLFFPMHMRGDAQSFTDMMHTILAINPFVHASIIWGITTRKHWFKYYSIVTILLLLVPAGLSFSSIPLLIAQQPTPWLGVTERISVYSHQTWHVVLAITLLREITNKGLAANRTGLTSFSIV